MGGMNCKAQIFCAALGPVFILVLFPAWLNMGFIPPLAPTLTPDQVFEIYDRSRNEIRLGAMLTMQFAIFGIAWTVAISAQMRRIEAGSTPVLTYLQLVMGSAGFFLFVIPCIFWTLAAFRADRSAELVYLLNDMGWLSLVMPVFPAAIQAFAIGVLILSDKGSRPVFPRWAGYLNFWCGINFLPGALGTFFKTGPFAWNGLFDFWLPLGVFSFWIAMMAVLVIAAARRQMAEERGGSIS